MRLLLISLSNMPNQQRIKAARKILQERGYFGDTSSPTASFSSLQEEPEKKSLGGFAENVFKSGADLVKNTAQAILHPVETVKGLANIGIGGAAKVVPGRQEQEDDFDAVVNFYKARYGSLDRLAETAYSDPIGFAADIATLAGGVGAVAKAGTAAKIGGLSEVSRAASTVNKLTDPLQAVTAIPKAILPESTISLTAQKLYQSALKPSTTLSTTERTQMLLTGLREGIPVTNKGYEILGKRIEAINNSIGKLIDDSAKAGDTVSRADIVTRLDDVRRTIGMSVDPKPLLKELDGLQSRFLSEADAIPVNQAQQIKTGTYRLLRKAYGEMKSTSIEGQKALARGIKEELVKKYPVLKNLNTREGALLRFEEALERAVGRISNRDVVGLGTAVAANANPIAGVVKAIIDNPYVKSKLAIALQKAADRVPRKSRFRRPIVPATRLTQPARESTEELEYPEF